jgi:4-carboxymuconolactone decarboxylase
VLGEAYVSKALADADDFAKPLQDLVTEYCWGAVWGREELPRRTRSMLNLAMISVLNRPNELRTHIKAALTNGVTRDEIREIFLQVAIYAGVPAAVDSFRIAREAFAELDQSSDKD